MTRKPVIGLNMDFVGATEERSAYSLICAAYYDRIMATGGIPLLVPPLEEETDLTQVLDRLDGFVLIGGRDLDPRNDGYMLQPSIRLMHPRREQFDRRLCRLICDRQMPLLAIGAGMQLLNVTMGGNLFLHLPEDLPRAIAHKDQHDRFHRHGLVLESGSILQRVYGDGEVRVSSMHHMAVDEVAPGFMVSARCPDGVIEAIESRIEGWFALGTQFHPECEAASALDIRIFEEFIWATAGEPVEVRLVA